MLIIVAERTGKCKMCRPAPRCMHLMFCSFPKISWNLAMGTIPLQAIQFEYLATWLGTSNPRFSNNCARSGLLIPSLAITTSASRSALSPLKWSVIPVS